MDSIPMTTEERIKLHTKDPIDDCVLALRVLAAKETSIRTRRYLLAQANQLSHEHTIKDITDHLMDLMVEAALRLKEVQP
jgi:hypothetical protein